MAYLARVGTGDTLKEKLQWMFENQKLVDVSLVCNSHLVMAHRAVIASYSPVLLELITIDENTMNSVIVMLDISLDILRGLLELMYSGSTIIRKKDMPSWFKTCKFLQLTLTPTLTRLNLHVPTQNGGMKFPAQLLEPHVLRLLKQMSISSNDQFVFSLNKIPTTAITPIKKNLRQRNSYESDFTFYEETEGNGIALEELEYDQESQVQSRIQEDENAASMLEQEMETTPAASSCIQEQCVSSLTTESNPELTVDDNQLTFVENSQGEYISLETALALKQFPGDKEYILTQEQVSAEVAAGDTQNIVVNILKPALASADTLPFTPDNYPEIEDLSPSLTNMDYGL